MGEEVLADRGDEWVWGDVPDAPDAGDDQVFLAYPALAFP